MKKLIYVILAMIIVSINFTSCIDDEPTQPVSSSETLTTVTDIDDNVYNIITIGTQTWMIENLRVSRYNDGTSIANVTNSDFWSIQTDGAYCSCNNFIPFDKKYGKLYNWHAINTGKLAPKGWHVATNAEWNILFSNIRIEESIFNNVKSGFRNHKGEFLNREEVAYWWTSTDDTNKEYAWDKHLNLQNEINGIGVYKTSGLSVRCVKD
jgi:uncharacterized secreted protein with C-terminal beta-propeller domain